MVPQIWVELPPVGTRRELFRIALRESRRTLDPDLAQDAAQEAVTRAWRNAHACRAADPRPWIRTIARREALRISGQRRPAPLLEDYEQDDQADSADAVHERLRLADALAQLPAPDRETIVLRYWADMTTQAIARETARPLGTTKVRLHRAHAKLARLLEEDP